MRKRFTKLESLLRINERVQVLSPYQSSYKKFKRIFEVLIFYLRAGGRMDHEKFVKYAELSGVLPFLIEEKLMALSPSNFNFTPGESSPTGELTWVKGDLATYTKITIRDAGQPVSAGTVIYSGPGTLVSVTQKSSIGQIIWAVSEDEQHAQQGPPVESSIPPGTGH
jgi:hypothetical protein